jgi:hypothetical protein
VPPERGLGRTLAFRTASASHHPKAARLVRRPSALSSHAPPEGGTVSPNLPREAGPDRRLRQGSNLVSRERRGSYSDVATTDFARGVAAPEMSPGFGAVLPPPKGLQHASRPRQAQSSDSRSVAALERTPGLRIRPSLPKELRCASRRHDRRDSRTRSGLYRSCPQYVGSVTLPPERGAARIRTPTTGVTLALGVAALELPPVHRSCPAPPRRTARSAF